jgi:hypothetical protein
VKTAIRVLTGTYGRMPVVDFGPLRLLAIQATLAGSGTGRRWCERIWTVLAICARQGRSAFDFLHDSIVAYFTR